MNELSSASEQQSLTPSQNEAIIRSLFEADTEEKKLAYRVVWYQLLLAITGSIITFVFEGVQQTATAVLIGGMVSVVNGVMLAWRMNRPVLPKALNKNDPAIVHRHLRLLYFYAAERFVLVVALLAVLIKLKFHPVALLGGFVFVQATMMVARLITFKLKHGKNV